MKCMLAVAVTAFAILAVVSVARPRPQAPSPAAALPTPAPSPAARSTERPAPVVFPTTPEPSTEPAPAAEDPRPKILARLRQAIRDGDLNAIAELRKELLAAITPPPIPDEKNGALVLQKAFPLLVPMGDPVQAAMDAALAGRATPDQLAALESYVAANASGLAILKQAAAFEKFRFPLPLEDGFNTLMPHIQEVMKAAKVVQAELALKGARGQEPGDAWQTLGALAESMREEPTLISQLVRYSVLQRGGGGDPESFRPILRDVMYAEMTAAIHYGQTELPWGSLAVPEVRAMAEYYFEFVVDAADLLQRPFHEIHAPLAEFMRERVENPAPEAQGVKMLAPSLGRIIERVAQAEILCGARLDPFTGKAFLERDGARYSPGPDLVDDGGDPAKDILLRPRPAR